VLHLATRPRQKLQISAPVGRVELKSSSVVKTPRAVAVDRFLIVFEDQLNEQFAGASNSSSHNFVSILSRPASVLTAASKKWKLFSSAFAEEFRKFLFRKACCLHLGNASLENSQLIEFLVGSETQRVWARARQTKGQGRGNTEVFIRPSANYLFGLTPFFSECLCIFAPYRMPVRTTLLHLPRISHTRHLHFRLP